MTNYRVRDGCHNCKHVFVRGDYDEGVQYFCTLDAPARPPCMSVGMGEVPVDFMSNHEHYDNWDAWSEGRQVRESGICDSWESP